MPRKTKLPTDHGNYHSPPQQLKVRTDGPDPENVAAENEQKDQGPTTWCRGDVDFLPDGSLFIRNPYLANAIEAQLKKNQINVAAGVQFEYYDDKGGTVKQPPLLFRMIRDQGFSGPKNNLVC